MHRQPMTDRRERGEDRMMEQRLKRGNQLHDQAIVDFCAWMVSIAMLSIRKARGSVGKIKGDNSGAAGRSIKGQHRIPV